jgi:hypothetical protein
MQEKMWREEQRRNKVKMMTKCAKVAHVGWSGDQGFEHARQTACCIAPNSTGRTMKKMHLVCWYYLREYTEQLAFGVQ